MVDAASGPPSATVALLREARAVAERLRPFAHPAADDLLGVLEHQRALLDASARLAAVVAWLLVRRAVETGERDDDPDDPLAALVPMPAPAPVPEGATSALRAALEDAGRLYARIRRLDAARRQAVGASG